MNAPRNTKAVTEHLENKLGVRGRHTFSVEWTNNKVVKKRKERRGRCRRGTVGVDEAGLGLRGGGGGNSVGWERPRARGEATGC
jgi:hypothetical protein